MHSMIQPREHWDRAASDPWGAVRSGWSESDFQSRTDETIVDWFPVPMDKTTRFLDLGCGVGYVCRQVAPRVGDYIGVDWSAPMLARARELNAEHGNASWRQCDGATIPCDDLSVDVLITEQMFYHVERPVILVYLQEICRVMTIDGVATLEIPLAEYYKNGLDWPEVLDVFPDAVRLEGGPDVVAFARVGA